MEILGFDLSAIDVRSWWNTAVAFVRPRVGPSLGVLAIAAFVYYPVRWMVGRYERRIAARTETAVDDLLSRLVRRALQISALAWACWRILNIWELPQVAGTVDAFWIAALSFPLSSFVGDALEAFQRRVAERNEGPIDDTAMPLLNKMTRFAVVLLGVLLGLDRLGLDIAPLLAGAGVMGLALSLAAKDTLSNLIAGVLLIMDRPFQIGDRIELWDSPAETGSWGDIIEIGLRATKIRNPDNLVIIVPNNQIMQRDIINYTMSGGKIRLRIPFDVEYDSDLPLAKDLVLEVAREVDGVAKYPEPVVILRGFGPSEVKLQLRVWIVEARRRRAIADAISAAVVQKFSENGVSMPYPKREVYVHHVEGDGQTDAFTQAPPGQGSSARGSSAEAPTTPDPSAQESSAN